MPYLGKQSAPSIQNGEHSMSHNLSGTPPEVQDAAFYKALRQKHPMKQGSKINYLLCEY